MDSASVNSPKKIAVVLKLEDIDDFKDRLDDLGEGDGKATFLKSFFTSKYGNGSSTLDVITKNNKVKLSWQAKDFNADAEHSHQAALSLVKQKNYSNAVNHWVKAIALNPHDPDYYFNLGIAFFELQNFKEAIENLNRVLNICPIYYKAHLILGTVYLKTRKFENAETHLKESIIFYPKHPLAYLNLGAVYSILKRYDDGIRMFLKTIALSPREVRAHFGLAKIYALTNDNQNAEKFYKNVIDINSNPQLTNHAKRAIFSVSQLSAGQETIKLPENISKVDIANLDKYYYQGYRSFLATDYEQSVKMYEIYLSHKKDDDFLWSSLGESYLRAGMIEKAISAFNNAIKLSPNKGLYYKEAAIGYHYLENFDMVLENCLKAERLDKADSIIYTIWGNSLLNVNSFDKAVEKLEKALQLNSNNLYTKLLLAKTYLQLNQNDFSLNYLHEIVRAQISSPLKMEAEALIKSVNS